jgi:hypothetical protein
MAYLKGVNRAATLLVRRLEERLLAGLSMGGYANPPVQGEASLDSQPSDEGDSSSLTVNDSA